MEMTIEEAAEVDLAEVVELDPINDWPVYDPDYDAVTADWARLLADAEEGAE